MCSNRFTVHLLRIKPPAASIRVPVYSATKRFFATYLSLGRASDSTFSSTRSQEFGHECSSVVALTDLPIYVTMPTSVPSTNITRRTFHGFTGLGNVSRQRQNNRSAPRINNNYTSLLLFEQPLRPSRASRTITVTTAQRTARIHHARATGTYDALREPCPFYNVFLKR